MVDGVFGADTGTQPTAGDSLTLRAVGRRSWQRPGLLGALKVVAFSYTASWVAGVFQIVPGIGMLLALAGSIYSIYLLYLGLPVLMKCPREKQIKP